jgi:hypothetical protein
MRALFSLSPMAGAVALIAIFLARSAVRADDEAPTASAATAAGGAKLSSLDSKTLQSMVIVEGERGRGSAFIVRMEGKV